MTVTKYTMITGVGLAIALTVTSVPGAQAAESGPRKVGIATVIDFAGTNGNTAYAGPTCVAAKPMSLDGLDWCFGRRS